MDAEKRIDDLLQQLLISIVQGITEFLPISSSGHLILIPYLTDLADQGPLIDVAVHVGSLLAIMVFFSKDVIFLARGGLSNFNIGNKVADYAEAKLLFWWIVIGTIQAVLFGLSIKLGFFNSFVENTFRIEILDGDLMSSIRFLDLIAVNLIIYGLLLGLADWFGKQTKVFEDMTWRDGLIVGIAQALAIIPGTSRVWNHYDCGKVSGLQKGLRQLVFFSFIYTGCRWCRGFNNT